MVQTNNDSRQSKNELASKSGDIARWVFLFRYYSYLWSTYPCQAENAEQQTLLDRVKSLLQSPLAWSEGLSGTSQDRDPDHGIDRVGVHQNHPSHRPFSLVSGSLGSVVDSWLADAGPVVA